MGKEATSWDWLRDGIKKTIPQFSLLDRVENGVVDGMADVNYVIRGVEGWIELKAVALPTRENTPVLGDKGMRISQINWHRERQQVLGKTWIFVSAAPYRWLVNGLYAAEVNEWTRDDFCVKSRFWYDDKWSKTQWDSFVRAIT